MEIVTFFYDSQDASLMVEPYTILLISEFNNRIQAKRMISTGKLNTLLHLHFQPIDVVVFDDP